MCMAAFEHAARQNDAPCPTPVIIDCDPGHDDAMALLLALASPELEIVGRHDRGRKPDAGQGHGERHPRPRRGRRAATSPSPPGADRALDPPRPAWPTRCTARPGLDGPDLPPPSREPEPIHAVELIARDAARAPAHADPDRPADQHRAAARACTPTWPSTDRADRADGRRDRPRQRHAQRPSSTSGATRRRPSASSTSGADVTMVGLDVTHRAMLSAARAEALRETGHAGAVVADLHAFYRRFHAGGLWA